MNGCARHEGFRIYISIPTPANSYLVTGSQGFGQNDTGVTIATEFRVRYQDSSRKKRETRDSRAVIEILDDELHQIFPTSELAQMVKRGEDLEFLQ